MTMRVKLLTALLAVGVTGAVCVTSAWALDDKKPADASAPAAAPSAEKRAEPGRPPLSAAELKSAWEDLAGTDETKIMRALLVLARAPEKTVPFLKEHLQPVKADDKRLSRLIAELDNDQFTVRNKASEELEYLGKCAKPALEQALKNNPPLEAKQRIEQLLAKLAPETPALPPAPPIIGALPQIGGIPAPPIGVAAIQVEIQVVNGQVVRNVRKVNGQEVGAAPKPSASMPAPQWIRAGRAVLLLEHLATPETQQILRTLADGEADALPTKAAKEALDRLGK